MLNVLKDIWPLLVSIAVHPIGFAIAIVIAGRPGGSKGGASFGAGFAIGVLAACAIGRVVAGWHFGRSGHHSRGDLAKADLVVGIVIILWALWSVTLGRKKTEYGYVGRLIERALPMSDGQLVVKGIKGALLNPKDLAVSVALGAHLAYLEPGAGAEVGAVIVFILVAILPLVIPAIIAAMGGSPERSRLLQLDAWIRLHLPLASAIVLVVMGLNTVRGALSHLSG